MPGGYGKFAAIAIAPNFVGVTVALGAGHGDGAVRNEFAHFRAVAVKSHVAALGLSDFEQVAADTGQADCLRGSRSRVGRRHPFQREIVDAKGHSDKNENANELAHNVSVRCGNNLDKIVKQTRRQRNTSVETGFRSERVC